MDSTNQSTNAEQVAQPPPEYIQVDGEQIAVRHRPGKQPGIFWLAGYRGDMVGCKAMALDGWSKQKGSAMTRHDYSGHGESSGKYQDGTITKWFRQSMAVFRRYVPAGQRQILVGSSMGAWIALRMVQELNKSTEAAQKPIAGLLLLAPAPDFTVELMEPELSAADREQLQTKGFYVEKSNYFPDEEGNIWTREFFEDARLNNRTLEKPFDPGCPVSIIHGLKDQEVPVKLVDKLVQTLTTNKIQRIQVPDAEHRLSRPEDIELILKTLDELVSKTEA